MQRARIIVKGEVQGVGYRGVIRKIARKLNIVGRIKNIKPYDVEIIAEGEKENLQQFIEQIRIKEFPIDVEDLEVTFKEATREFESFEVEREDLAEEIGERFDLARIDLNKLHEAQKIMIDQQDMMLEKQDKTIEVLGGKIDSVGMKVDTVGEKVDQGFTKTDQNFSTLREDYGKISQTMEKILESMSDTSKKTEKILEVLTKQQQDFTQAINGLTGAILKLAEKSR